MTTPLRRIQLGAIFLAAIFMSAVIGYHYLGGYEWIDAVWVVVVTISSVGYAERSIESTQVQLLSIGVIILGMSAAFYTVGGLIQLMLEGEIQSALGQRRRTREVERLENHVVVCGYGRIGEMLATDLRHKGREFVVIDNDSMRVNQATQDGCLALLGDALEEELLVSAGIRQARTVVSVLPVDALNVFITLTARDLNPDVQIIARAEQHSSEKKLRQAGANRVVMPAVSGAKQMSRMITRPSTADFMELLAERDFSDVEMDEVSVGVSSRLVGSSVAETQTRQKHGLLVIAIKQQDGNLVFNPSVDHVFQGNDTVIVMGGAQDIERFRNECVGATR